MKRITFLLLILGVSGFVMGSACEEVQNAAEATCGECGSIANGDITITGNAELDGLFKAVGDIDMATSGIKSRFDARVKSLAENVFDIDASGKSPEVLITEIELAFEQQITANLEGDISVAYIEPKCSAAVDVAVSAQAKCEAKAGCDVDANVQCDPGELSFECEGKCTGACSAKCEGSCTVTGEVAAACEGECNGTCELDVAAECSGTCIGTCNGECSLVNTEGECEGECSGTCEGVCEMNAGGNCEGTCHGECTFDATAEAQCEGTCEGSCSGECTGGCEGQFTPPRCDADARASCEASADCEAQASAQASANLSCTPPTIELDYRFKSDLDTQTRASIGAKLKQFRAELIPIIQGMTELRALVDSEYAGELGVTSPVTQMSASIDIFAKKVASGEFEISAVGLLPCAAPAFADAGAVLISLPTDMAATIDSQMRLAAIIGI